MPVDSNPDFDIAFACQGGHRNLVQLMVENDAWDWSEGLSGACQGGHSDLVKYIVEKGAWNLDQSTIFERNDLIGQPIDYSGGFIGKMVTDGFFDCSTYIAELIRSIE